MLCMTFIKIQLYKDNLDEDLKKSGYILSTIHRRENINSFEKLSAIFKNLNKINNSQKIIMPLHPHTKQKIEKYKIQTNISLAEPLGYISMLSLLNDCVVILIAAGCKKNLILQKRNALLLEIKRSGLN